MGTSFLLGILLARMSGKVVFGQYAYIISFVSLLSPLCLMGLNNIATKYVVKRPANSHFYIKSILYVRGAGAFVSIILGLTLVQLSSTSVNYASELILLLLFQAFQFTYVIEYYFLAKNDVTSPLKIRIFSYTVTSGVKLYVIWQQLGVFPLIAAHGLHYVIVGFGYLVYYYSSKAHRKIKRNVTIHSTLTLFHQGKWLLLAGLAALIYLKIDQIMLGNIHGMAEVGTYAAAARLSEFWYIFPVLVANAFYPKLLQYHKKNPLEFNKVITKLLSYLFFFALLLSLTTFLVSDSLILLVYGKDYQVSASILSIHIIATCFVFQRAFFSKWLITNNLFKYSLYTQGFGAICNIALNLWWIPSYGGVGAAWATVCSYATASYLSLIFSSKTRPFAIMMTLAMLQWPRYIKDLARRKLVLIVRNTK